MNILLTGAPGYAGSGIAEVLAAKHNVRGVAFGDSAAALKKCACQEIIAADITDYEACRGLLKGMDAMVLCHMAPNPQGYKIPPPAFDVNVKGTANLYHAAGELGIKKAVLISTKGVIAQTPAKTGDTQAGIGPYNFKSGNHGLYVLTKIFQECIARYYFVNFGIATAVLRPGWILYDDMLITKYGEKMDHYDPTLIDPRDIGTAIVAALALPDLELESFCLGQADMNLDMSATQKRLKWSPHHRFASLPRVPQPAN